MSKTKQGTWFIPVTPAGTPVIWSAGSRGPGKLNAAQTEDEAWANLLADAAHMPYRNKADLIERGYTVESWDNYKP